MTERHSRRVLIVTAYVPPTGGGGTIRMTKLARHLAPLGWGADMVGWADAPDTLTDEALLDELPPGSDVLRVSTPLRRLEVRWGAKVRRGSGPSTRRFQAIDTVRSAFHGLTAIPDPWIGWATRVALLARRRLAAGRPVDAVLSSGPPHAAHLAGLVLARRFRVPFLMDLRDDWTVDPRFAGVGLQRPVIAALEAACIGRAAAVVTISDASGAELRRMYPRHAHRIHVITNGFDPGDLAGVTPRVAAAPGGRVLVGHLGSLRAPRDLRPVLRSIARLRNASDAPALRLILAGDVDEDQVEAARAVMGDAIDVHGHLPHREAVALMARCDVLLLVGDSRETTPSAVAGKLYEELAVRRPILAVTPGGAAGRLVVGSNAGVWADPEDPAAIDRALRRVLELASDPSFTGAPDELIARFDRRLQAVAWRDLLDRAAATRRGAAGSR